MFTSVFNFLGVAIPADVLGALGLILGLICLDVILGIFLAISKKEFSPTKLAGFLETSILPYVGSLLMLGVFAAFVPQIQALFLTSTAAAAVKFLWDIKNKFMSISGSSLPSGGDITNPPVDIIANPRPAKDNASVVTPAASKTLPDEPKEPPAK